MKFVKGAVTGAAVALVVALVALVIAFITRSSFSIPLLFEARSATSGDPSVSAAIEPLGILIGALVGGLVGTFLGRQRDVPISG